MKKSSVITLILAGVLLTNCVSCLNEKKPKKEREPKETSETTEETEETTPSPTVTPTPAPTIEPTATPMPTTKPAPTKDPSQTIAVDDISEDEITDSIDDGTYYGEIVAVSEDGDYMLVTVGDPVSVTKEEYDALEVGDVVYSGEYSGDVYVQEIDDKGNKILSDYSMWFAPNGFTGNEDEYILVTSSVNPMTVNDKLFVVPISPDCEIDDHTEYLFSEPAWNEMDGSYDEYLDNLEDSTSLQETLYWFHFMVNNESGSLGNGWRETGGLIYPIVVENGEVTMMSIQWR